MKSSQHGNYSNYNDSVDEIQSICYLKRWIPGNKKQVIKQGNKSPQHNFCLYFWCLELILACCLPFQTHSVHIYWEAKALKHNITAIPRILSTFSTKHEKTTLSAGLEPIDTNPATAVADKRDHREKLVYRITKARVKIREAADH